MTSSYRLAVSSTQNKGAPFFPFFLSLNLVLYLHVWVKVEVSPTTATW